jgi:hypothetical protein
MDRKVLEQRDAPLTSQWIREAHLVQRCQMDDGRLYLEHLIQLVSEHTNQPPDAL